MTERASVMCLVLALGIQVPFDIDNTFAKCDANVALAKNILKEIDDIITDIFKEVLDIVAQIFEEVDNIIA